MQKELNEQIEKMKEQMLKGEKENMQGGKMSKELVEMLEASRQYQNNIEVVSTLRNLMMRTINMGK